jgi:hypothetical protein
LYIGGMTSGGMPNMRSVRTSPISDRFDKSSESWGREADDFEPRYSTIEDIIGFSCLLSIYIRVRVFMNVLCAL